MREINMKTLEVFTKKVYIQTDTLYLQWNFSNYQASYQSPQGWPLNRGSTVSFNCISKSLQNLLDLSVSSYREATGTILLFKKICACMQMGGWGVRGKKEKYQLTKSGQNLYPVYRYSLSNHKIIHSFSIFIMNINECYNIHVTR